MRQKYNKKENSRQERLLKKKKKIVKTNKKQKQKTRQRQPKQLKNYSSNNSIEYTVIKVHHKISVND